MTIDYLSIKKKLLSECGALIQNKINTNNDILARLQESLTSETKSSAGDKFETSRAMLQAEIDRHKVIVIKAKERAYLLQGTPVTTTIIIKSGSLILTDKVTYFIAVGLGKVTLDGSTYYVISTTSPIGQQMLGKKANDTITFNNNSFDILAVY